MYSCGRNIVLSQARVAVRLLYLGWKGSAGLMFFLQIARNQRADERTRTADLLITSLLADVPERPTASGKCAYLGGFWCTRANLVSFAY